MMKKCKSCSRYYKVLSLSAFSKTIPIELAAIFCPFCGQRVSEESYQPQIDRADLIDLSEMLIEALGDWIVSQPEEIKASVAKAFGGQMKALGQTLYKHSLNKAACVIGPEGRRSK